MNTTYIKNTVKYIGLTVLGILLIGLSGFFIIPLVYSCCSDSPIYELIIFFPAITLILFITAMAFLTTRSTTKSPEVY